MSALGDNQVANLGYSQLAAMSTDRIASISPTGLASMVPTQDMPIASAVVALLDGQLTPAQGVAALMGRDARPER